MENYKTRLTAVQRAAAQEQTRVRTDNELLDLYLILPTKEREEQFADTARVAEMTGAAQRTIQFWIEIGLLQVVRIGRKYKVSLESLRECLKKRIDS